MKPTLSSFGGPEPARTHAIAASAPPTNDEVCGPSPWSLVIAPDGRYVDGGVAALDLYGVTLDVLRQMRVAPDTGGDERDAGRSWYGDRLASGEDWDEIEWPVARVDGYLVRVAAVVERRSDGNHVVTLTPAESGPFEPPALRIRALLDRWRRLERQLAAAPCAGDVTVLHAAIEALREEYRRRTANP